MLARTIGRAAAVAGFILSGAAWAQDPKPADTETLRQGVAQGAAFCKAHLASAPPDLRLSEVEDFCTCMGVHEFAMTKGAMTDSDKAVIRPRQQQMCVEIVRKQGAAPAPAVTPTAPPSPPPAPPVTAEQPAANVPAPAVAAQPAPVERIEQWTITRNTAGAPIAYARATDTPSVGAFTMYCRASDAIGFRVKYKSGFNEKHISVPMGGWISASTPTKTASFRRPLGQISSRIGWRWRNTRRPRCASNRTTRA